MEQNNGEQLKKEQLKDMDNERYYEEKENRNAQQKDNGEGIKFDEFGDNNELKCDVCGMSYSEFLKTGVFGCQNCYILFKKSTIQIIKNKMQKNYDANYKENKKCPNTLLQMSEDCQERKGKMAQRDKKQTDNHSKEKSKEIHMKIKELGKLLAMYEADKNYEKIDLIKAEIKKLKELEIEKN